MSKTLRKENRKSVPKIMKKESKIKQRSEDRKLISRVLKGVAEIEEQYGGV